MKPPAFRTGALEWREDGMDGFVATIGPFKLQVWPITSGSGPWHGGGVIHGAHVMNTAVLFSVKGEPDAQTAAKRAHELLRSNVGAWATLVCGAP